MLKLYTGKTFLIACKGIRERQKLHKLMRLLKLKFRGEKLPVILKKLLHDELDNIKEGDLI